MPETRTPLRELFAGPRGRLLGGLLLAEASTALQVFATSTTLPFAARDLDGARLYGAALAASTLATIAALAVSASVTGRLGPRRLLGAATAAYGTGVVLGAVAPAMAVLIAGQALRGAGAGLLGGFGLTAIVSLYPGRDRDRIVGLVGTMWLLPSVVGPPVSALVTTLAGWRWALVLVLPLVVGARVVVGRHLRLLPPASAAAAPPAVPLAALLGGTTLALAGGSNPGRWGLGALVAGVVVAAAGTVRLLRPAAGGDRRRAVAILGLGLVCVAFFGGDNLLSLAVVEGLGGAAAAAAVVIGAGSLTWSALGFVVSVRPPDRAHARTGGLGLITVGLAGLVAALLVPGPLGGRVALAAIAWAVAGAGVGIAYPAVTLGPFEGLAAGATATVAAAVALTETLASALASLAGGTGYAYGLALHVRPAVSLAWVFAAFAVLAAASAVLFAWTGARSRVSSGAGRTPSRPRS